MPGLTEHVKLTFTAPPNTPVDSTPERCTSCEAMIEVTNTIKQCLKMLETFKHARPSYRREILKSISSLLDYTLMEASGICRCNKSVYMNGSPE